MARQSLPGFHAAFDIVVAVILLCMDFFVLIASPVLKQKSYRTTMPGRVSMKCHCNDEDSMESEEECAGCML